MFAVANKQVVSLIWVGSLLTWQTMVVKIFLCGSPVSQAMGWNSCFVIGDQILRGHTRD